MFRAYQYVLYPTARQGRALEHLLAVQCEAYNAALEERREAFKRGIRVHKFDQFAQLKDLHESRPDFMQYGVTVARGTLTRLDRAFCAFYRRVAAGQRPGFPRFKARGRFDCCPYEDTSGWKLKEADHRLYLQGIGHVKLKVQRPLRGTPKTLHLRRQGRRFTATIQCADVPARPLPPTGRQAGFDLGVVNLATSSEGEVFDNPRDLARGKEALVAAQQALSRKKLGSKRRRRAREGLSRQHQKIANRRRNGLHQLSRRLVNGYDLLVFEDLAVAIHSARGTVEAPGSMVVQKAGLNREILAAAWGGLIGMVAYKAPEAPLKAPYEAEEAGRELILVNPRHTSQRCSSCGHTEAANRPSQATFACRACGLEVHADCNAARNVLWLGSSLRREKREAETGAA
ncbi:MAG TPA: transposase [Actinomycetota bacterium]|nr:transposase [Actinomycetota bacterium]